VTYWIKFVIFSKTINGVWPDEIVGFYISLKDKRFIIDITC
ncbi:uncharacterized protein METZ01_LOCUS82400, partial [marine metagenome]